MFDPHQERNAGYGSNRDGKKGGVLITASLLHFAFRQSSISLMCSANWYKSTLHELMEAFYSPGPLELSQKHPDGIASGFTSVRPDHLKPGECCISTG